MKKNISHIILYIFFSIGIIWSGSLAWTEFTQKDICPQILNIPACYIIFFFFVILFVLSFLNKLTKVYYALASIPFAIALYATFFQLLWTVECPKTDGWLPMCYISLFLFSGLIVMKYILSRGEKM